MSYPVEFDFRNPYQTQAVEIEDLENENVDGEGFMSFWSSEIFLMKIWIIVCIMFYNSRNLYV